MEMKTDSCNKALTLITQLHLMAVMTLWTSVRNMKLKILAEYFIFSGLDRMLYVAFVILDDALAEVNEALPSSC